MTDRSIERRKNHEERFIYKTWLVFTKRGRGRKMERQSFLWHSRAEILNTWKYETSRSFLVRFTVSHSKGDGTKGR